MDEPTELETCTSEMLHIFRECQENSLSHDRLCIQLMNYYEKIRFAYFADEFFELCRYSLVSAERTVYRERLIDFVTKFALFCGRSEDGQPQDTLGNRLLLKFFLFCIKYHECPNPAVRFRCMQLIHKLLEGIGDNGVLPDELYNSIQKVLLRRVNDVKALVRVHAVQALSRMQDPTDAGCPAVEAFTWMSRHDPTSEVRKAALAAMVLTTHTLPVLVDRCRDVADSVRRTAYRVLTARCILRPLSIAKRIRLLQDGLTDRSAEVRQAAEQMLLAWFEVAQRDPIHLLRRLDTEGVPETSQLALTHLFRALSAKDLASMVTSWASSSLTEERVLKPECHTAEAAFFWRSVVEFLLKHQSKKETNEAIGVGAVSDRAPQPQVDGADGGSPEEVCHDGADLSLSPDALLPSVTAYVDLAKCLVDKLVQTTIAEAFDERVLELECVLEHVLRLANSLDLSDEFGRRKLAGIVHDWITSPRVPSTLSPQLVRLHSLLQPNLLKRVNHLVEMVSELCDYTEPQPSLSNNTADKSANDTDHVPTTSLQGHNTDPAGETTTNQQQQQQPAPVASDLSKEAEQMIRLHVARLEVRLNELNESLHNCVQRKAFEEATELRDKCAILEVERNNLLHKLHGSIVPVVQLTPADRRDPQTGAAVTVAGNSSGESLLRPDGVNVRQEREPATITTTTMTITDLEADGAQEDEGEKEDERQWLHERCSPAVLIKANRIATLLVQQSHNLWRLPASLRSLLDSLILPSIQHLDTSVRNQAMQALGLCCSIDLPLALQYMSMFYSALRVDHVLISETALKAIVDCLLLYGFRPFHEANVRPNRQAVVVGQQEEEEEDDEDEDESGDDESGPTDYVVLLRRNVVDPTSGASYLTVTHREDMSRTVARMLKPIVALLNSEDDDLRTTSALGLAKLLIYDRFVSPSVLSRLLLLWYSPLSEDRPAIRRQLAIFFSDYACAGIRRGAGAVNSGSTAAPAPFTNAGASIHECHQAALADAVLPTLTRLIRAPASSPLSEIEAVDVAGLLARLTDATQLPTPAGGGGTALALPSEPANGDEVDNEATTGDVDTGVFNSTVGATAGEPKAAAALQSGLKTNPQHDRLCSILVTEVLKAPQSAEAKLYLRLLCQLRPSPANVTVHRQLLLMCDSMLKFVDRSSGLLLHRFRKQVNESLQRLGLDPDRVLSESRPPVNQPNRTRTGGTSTTITTTAGGGGQSDEDGEVNFDMTRLSMVNLTNLQQQNQQPTLLGSARPNVHLLTGGGPAAGAAGVTVGGQSHHDEAVVRGKESQHHHQLINRTHPTGLSVLDKSGFHRNILNFSDDEEDEYEQEQRSTVVGTAATAVNNRRSVAGGGRTRVVEKEEAVVIDLRGEQQQSATRRTVAGGGRTKAAEKEEAVVIDLRGEQQQSATRRTVAGGGRTKAAEKEEAVVIDLRGEQQQSATRRRARTRKVVVSRPTPVKQTKGRGGGERPSVHRQQMQVTTDGSTLDEEDDDDDDDDLNHKHEEEEDEEVTLREEEVEKENVCTLVALGGPGRNLRSAGRSGRQKSARR